MKKFLKGYLIFCVASNAFALVSPAYRRWTREVYLPWVFRVVLRTEYPL